MKSQEVAVYREIQRNTEKALKALDTLSDKIFDEKLSMQVSRQALKYSELHNEAMKELLAVKAEPYQGNHIEDLALKTGIHYNTMLNTSTGHIAELLIKGSHQGMLDMEKILKHNEQLGEHPRALARQLIDFEEKSIKCLKDYL